MNFPIKMAKKGKKVANLRILHNFGIFVDFGGQKSGFWGSKKGSFLAYFWGVKIGGIFGPFLGGQKGGVFLGSFWGLKIGGIFGQKRVPFYTSFGPGVRAGFVSRTIVFL